MRAENIFGVKIVNAGTCDGDILAGSEVRTLRHSDVGRGNEKTHIHPHGIEAEMSHTEKIRCRGTKEKTAVPCGFREARVEVADGRISGRTWGMVGRKKVDQGPRGLNVDSQVRRPKLHGRRLERGAAGVFIIIAREARTYHGCGELSGVNGTPLLRGIEFTHVPAQAGERMAGNGPSGKAEFYPDLRRGRTPELLRVLARLRRFKIFRNYLL